MINCQKNKPYIGQMYQKEGDLTCFRKFPAECSIISNGAPATL